MIKNMYIYPNRIYRIDPKTGPIAFPRLKINSKMLAYVSFSFGCKINSILSPGIWINVFEMPCENLQNDPNIIIIESLSMYLINAIRLMLMLIVSMPMKTTLLLPSFVTIQDVENHVITDANA